MSAVWRKVELPCDIDINNQTSKSICESLEIWLNNHCDLLEEYLTANVWQWNAKAEYVRDSLSIKAVTHDADDCYCMEYEYTWEAYYGCRDMNQGESVDDEVCFEFINGKLLFEFLIFKEPTADDEL